VNKNLQVKLSKLGISLAMMLPLTAAADSLNGGAISATSASLGGAVVTGTTQPLDVMTGNPATLSDVRSRALSLGVSSVFTQGSFNNASNTNAGMSPFSGAVPYGAFVTPLGKTRFKLGLVVAPESSLAAKWRYVDAPGGLGGTTSYGLQDNKSAILTLRSAVGLGFAVTPKLSVGFTVGAVYNTNTLQTAYVFQSQPVLKGFKTLIDLHTQGVGWNESVGVNWRMNSKLQFGAAYKTRTLIHSHGDLDGNAGAQLTALGAPISPTFHYDAQVDNVMPQSVIAGVSWQIKPRVRVVVQNDFINWNKAFTSLPVILTNGSNAGINSVAGSSSLRDDIPLGWSNQDVIRAGVETSFHEHLAWRAGYSFSTNPVPAATLMPLTAAILQNTIGTGVGYARGRYDANLTYQCQLPSSEQVGQSSILSGEFNNSRVQVMVHSVSLTTSMHF
jgi:long-subunit fatty acid transport protein